MTDFESLDADTRCFAFVGQFLRGWADVESGLHDCICTAFKLSPTSTHILCANLKVQDKLAIMRTVVHIAAIKSEQNRAHFTSMLRRVGRLATRRNMVAHTPFRPEPGGTGVEFSHIEAKGTYDPSAIIWTIKMFDREQETICTLKTRLAELNAELQKSPIRDEVYRESLAATLMTWNPSGDSQVAWQAAIRHRGLQAALHSQTHHTPIPLDSDPAIPEKTSQIPDKPEK